MNAPSPYYDLRSTFFREYFSKALAYDDYLKTGKPEHRERWNNYASLVALSENNEAVISTFIRTMHVLVLSGTWCGDCARQGPMLHAITSRCEKMQLRFIDNQEHPALQEELLINGAKKVPVVVVLSEDFFELARFGDRHLSVYRNKLQREAGTACDPGILPPSTSELSTEVTEWCDFFERCHAILRLAPLLRKRYQD